MKRVACLALALFIALSLSAGGFESPDQSAKAISMGGAFVAQADDPTAIYYNPGGLALLKKPKGASVGAVTSRYNESLYQGLPPGSGAGTTGEQETPMIVTPHIFGTLPFRGTMVMGVGAYTPFRMKTEWTAPETFAGRHLAIGSELQTYDVATALGVRFGETFGLGAAFIYRTSEVSAARRVPVIVSGVQHDVATLDLKTDNESAFGWTAGVLHKAGPRFSWGATFRSAIETEYIGVGKLTQIPTGDAQLDALVRTQFAFDQELALASALQFPSQATLGIAIGGEPLTFEIDVRQTAWKDVEAIRFAFPTNPNLDTTYQLAFEDTMSYSAGLRFQFPTGPEIRLGYSLDESPQPDETVGAFLPDAGRSTISAGVGLDWLNVAVAWTTFDQRVVTTNVDSLNGNWRASAWSVAITATK